MKRWGMRNPSVSSTRAGPMTTPGETGVPRLISMFSQRLFKGPIPFWDSRASGDACSTSDGLFARVQIAQEIGQGVQGLLFIGSGDLQRQWSAFFGGQTQERQR